MSPTTAPPLPTAPAPGAPLEAWTADARAVADLALHALTAGGATRGPALGVDVIRRATERVPYQLTGQPTDTVRTAWHAALWAHLGWDGLWRFVEGFRLDEGLQPNGGRGRAGPRAPQAEAEVLGQGVRSLPDLPPLTDAQWSCLWAVAHERVRVAAAARPDLGPERAARWLAREPDAMVRAELLESVASTPAQTSAWVGVLAQDAASIRPGGVSAHLVLLPGVAQGVPPGSAVHALLGRRDLTVAHIYQLLGLCAPGQYWRLEGHAAWPQVVEAHLRAATGQAGDAVRGPLTPGLVHGMLATLLRGQGWATSEQMAWLARLARHAEMSSVLRESLPFLDRALHA